MARPTKFNPKYHIPWIKGLARRGYTANEIAADIEVAPSTFKKWLAENEELADAVKRGRSFSDTKVETSLYQRATGYKITKRKTVISTDANGKPLPAKIETYEEDVPPDTTACIFWLKNRNPELWRDRQEVAVSNNEWVKALEEVVDGPKK